MSEPNEVTSPVDPPKAVEGAPSLLGKIKKRLSRLSSVSSDQEELGIEQKIRKGFYVAMSVVFYSYMLSMLVIIVFKILKHIASLPY